MKNTQPLKKLRSKIWLSAIISLVLFVAGAIGFYFGWQQVKKPVLVVLAFHGVTDKPSFPWEIYPDTLENFLSQFKRYDYLPVDPVSFSEMFQHGFSSRNFLLTFDDGLKTSAETIKRLFRERGIKSVFFIVTDLIGKPGYVSAQDISELQNSFGCHIALHGKRHYEVTKIINEGHNLTAELEQARKDLGSITGNNIEWYAYPFGDYNASAAACIASTGIKMAFTIDGTDISEASDRMLIPRVMYLKGAKEAGEADPADWTPPRSAGTGSLTITLSILVVFFGMSWLLKAMMFARTLKQSEGVEKQGNL